MKNDHSVMSNNWFIVGEGRTSTIIHDLIIQEDFRERSSFKGFITTSISEESKSIEYAIQLPCKKDIKITNQEDVYSILNESSFDFFNSIGYSNMNIDRQKVSEKILLDFSLSANPSYISCDAYVSNSSTIKDGCLVMPMAVIEPHVQCEDGLLIWFGSHIAHHSIVKRYSWLAAKSIVGANCIVGERSFVGINGIIPTGSIVGPSCLICAGAVSPRAMEENSVSQRLHNTSSMQRAKVKATELIRFL